MERGGCVPRNLNLGQFKKCPVCSRDGKGKGLKVIGLLGRDGGRIRGYSDTAIVVPEQETFKIQELHLPVYHALCLMLEEYFFKIYFVSWKGSNDSAGS